MRRSITLISADWDRTIVIRRELPRTKNAGWVRPHRIKLTRILLTTRLFLSPALCPLGVARLGRTKLPGPNLPFPRIRNRLRSGDGTSQGRAKRAGGKP